MRETSDFEGPNDSTTYYLRVKAPANLGLLEDRPERLLGALAGLRKLRK